MAEEQDYQRLERNGQYPSIEVFYKIVQLFQLSADECFFPDVRPARSGRRRRLEDMMDRLDDTELLVIESSIKGLMRMKEENMSQ